jgi:DNA-binding transcriptional MerR regulator
MDAETTPLTIQDLSERTGIPIRTIRFYISQRLLPGPEGRGPATCYTEDHFRRLLLIRQLTQRHVPLSDISGRLERVSAEELAQVLADEEQRVSAEQVARDGSPRDYLSALLERARQERSSVRGVVAQLPAAGPAGGVWRRVPIAPGLELHVAQDSEPLAPEVIERIVAYAQHAVNRTKGRISE